MAGREEDASAVASPPAPAETPADPSPAPTPVNGAAVSPPAVAAMLAAVRGGGASVSSSPPSVAGMLAAVRGEPDPGGSVSPPSVAAMVAAVTGRAVETKTAAKLKPAEAKKPAGARPSVADILAQARGGKQAAGAETRAEAKPTKLSTAEILARARGIAPAAAKPAAAPKAKRDDGPPPIPLSVAEMVAALREREAADAVPSRRKRPGRSPKSWLARVFGSRG